MLRNILKKDYPIAASIRPEFANFLRERKREGYKIKRIDLWVLALAFMHAWCKGQIDLLK